MQKETTVGITGTIISIIFVIAGYIWDMIELQVIFSFLTGTFSTYLIQHRLQLETEKRTNNRNHHILLRDEIYGPLYEAANDALERIKTAEEMTPPIEGAYSPTMAIKHAMTKYHFLLIDEQRKNEISKLYADLVEYEKLSDNAETTILKTALPIIKQKYPKADVYYNPISFGLTDKQTLEFNITLQKTLLTQVNPFDKIQMLWTKSEDPKYSLIIPKADAEIDPEDVKRIFIDIQEKVSKEKRLIDYWSKRQELLSYIPNILPALKKKIEGKN